MGMGVVLIVGGGLGWGGGVGWGGGRGGKSPCVTLVWGRQLQAVLVIAVGKERQAGDVNILQVGVVLQNCLHITWSHLHIVPVGQQHSHSESVSTSGSGAAEHGHTLPEQNSA